MAWGWPMFLVSLAGIVVALLAFIAGGNSAAYELNDSHFHLTNYVQQGTDISQALSDQGGFFPELMTDMVAGRTVPPAHPAEANHRGIAVIYQEFSLVPALTA
jgi:hypothetical protein